MPKHVFFVSGVALVGLYLAACGSKGDAGPAGPQGPSGGADGGATAASFSMVVPRVGLLGGEGDFVVTAVDDTLTSAATLDFGSGITVSNVSAISVSSLSVHLVISDAAAVGPRDVKITAGAKVLTGTGAFEVDAPVQVAASSPGTALSAGQGSLVFAELTNLDTTSAWDPSDFAVTASFGGLVSSAVGGADVTGTNAYVALAIDPLGTPGSFGLVAGNSNGTTMLTSEFSDPNAVTVTAATPKVVPGGSTLGSENLATAGAVKYYSVTTTGVSIVDVSTVPSGDTIQPTTLGYSSAGKWSDLLLLAAPQQSIFGNSPAADVVFGTGSTSETTYYVVFDSAFGGGASSHYGYSFAVSVTPATAVAEQAVAHADDTTAQALTTGSGVVVTGTLSQPGEIDIYSFTGAINDQWEFSYTESANSFLLVGLDSGGLPDQNNPLAAMQATAPSRSTSNNGALNRITAPGDAGSGFNPGTYYIAVVGSSTQGANVPYTFTAQNTIQ